MASMVFDMIIDKLLGTYLCIGERKLDFSSGTLTMKNVMVREDVLDSLSLPVALRGGEIGELEVQVPWSKLKTESVVVKINRVGRGRRARPRRGVQGAHAAAAAQAAAAHGAVRQAGHRTHLRRAPPLAHPRQPAGAAHLLRGTGRGRGGVTLPEP